MAPTKSLDDSKIIAALLHDVSTSHGAVFNTVAYRKTVKKVERRLQTEGIGFLTKTLPRLGKAFDKALAGDIPLNSVDLRFKPQENSKLPRFLGELFNEVLGPDGTLLQHPCEKCVRIIRQVCYLYYKYELPYTTEQEQQVIQKFERTEEDLSTVSVRLGEIQRIVDATTFVYRRRYKTSSQQDVVREARILLSRLFSFFDPKDIRPRHGPGAVATKQHLWEKYQWRNVSAKITKMYPLDEYFYSSLGHVCDRLTEFSSVSDTDLPARVILVPKDSRGPRLISCEPVDYQWIQQGLGRAIVELVEHNELTKFNVFFTDQSPNQIAALYGSQNGRYATLDLNEASDRISVDLVRLLFPPHIYEYLDACRSSSTVLPSGKEVRLRKFAPMGSCLCFPILALTIWSILTAAAPDAYTRERIHVYGDDVIVPTAYAGDAMEQLESFGLKVNRDKSCTKGLFRESCGTDAFNGVNVTPVRLRTVWSSSRSPDVYSSWIAYANSFFDKQYYTVYEVIVEALHAVYGAIPAKDMNLSCPSLIAVSDDRRPRTSRTNSRLQKREWFVWDVGSRIIHHSMDGWDMLNRFFAEKGVSPYTEVIDQRPSLSFEGEEPFSVSSYTRRRTSMLVRRWR